MFFTRLYLILTAILLIPYVSTFALGGFMDSPSKGLYLGKQPYAIDIKNIDFLGRLSNFWDIAQTGSFDSNTGLIEKEKKNLEDLISKEKEIEDRAIEFNFSKVTIDTAKLDFEKKLRSLEKSYPDTSIRIEVYKGIRKTLFLRKQVISKWKLSDDPKNILLDIYGSTLDSIDKKIKDLE